MKTSESFIALGSFLAEHPDLDAVVSEQKINVYLPDLAKYARSIGTCEKVHEDRYYNLRKSFGKVTVDFFAMREEVCKRVKVGEKVVPEHIIPARPEEVVPETKEDVYEWQCSESLLATEEAQ